MVQAIQQGLNPQPDITLPEQNFVWKHIQFLLLILVLSTLYLLILELSILFLALEWTTIRIKFQVCF